MDEAFDVWELSKVSKDYGNFFGKAATHPDAQGMTWAEFDIKQMVDMGKNDPSIIMWSLGNEIVKATVPTAQKLVGWVKQIDTTRPVTQGYNNFIANFNDDAIKEVVNQVDLAGLNYGEGSYDAAHREFPNWLIFGAETSSAVRSRGFYSNDDTLHIRSSYDDAGTVGWGRSAESAWKADRDRKFVAGQFIWTGFDYVGEPSPYDRSFPRKKLLLWSGRYGRYTKRCLLYVSKHMDGCSKKSNGTSYAPLELGGQHG